MNHFTRDENARNTLERNKNITTFALDTFTVLLLATLLLSSPVPAAVHESQSAVLEGLALEGDSVTRGYNLAEGDLYRLDVPSSAVVTLDVMTPSVEDNPVWIDLVDDGAGNAVVLHRSATHLALDVKDPQTLWLRVLTRKAGRYKLVTSLAAVPAPRGLTQKTEPELVDPDPDPDGILAVEPSEDGTCGAAGRGDDHGDTPACATPLRIGDRAAGEVGNAWGDDVDVFTLTLGDVTAVELTLLGDGTAALHDLAGNRLAVNGTAARTWTATLSPGRYLVRVEGVGVAASYELSVASRPW